MRVFKHVIILTVWIIQLFGCQNQKVQSDLETDVLNDIFKELTDSLFYYPAFPLPPPPPPLSIDSKEPYPSRDYREMIAKIDTNRLVLSISDSTEVNIHFIENYNLYIDRLSQLGLEKTINNLKDKPNKPINFEKIKNTGRYELMKFSNILESNANPGYPYKFIYYGNMILSRIYFNDSLTTGLLTCEILCGSECNYSYLILVRKDKLTWIISKMIRLSIV